MRVKKAQRFEPANVPALVAVVDDAVVGGGGPFLLSTACGFSMGRWDVLLHKGVIFDG